MFTTIIGFRDGYRGDPLEASLRSQGINPSRTLGVRLGDLPHPPEAYVDQVAAKIFLRRKMTAGEIGCSLAHRNAYSDFLRSDQPTALIFEDDARLRSRLPLEEIGNYFESSQPRILLLDWNPGWTIVSPSKKRAACLIYRAPFAPIDARGYALNRAAALLLIDGGAPVDYVADWPVRAAASIEFSVMYPRPVESGEGVASTLETDRQRQGKVHAERRLRKALRLLATASHVSWLRNRHIYGTYQTYVRHELLRLPSYSIARRLNRRLDAADPLSPMLAPTAVTLIRNSHRRST